MGLRSIARLPNGNNGVIPTFCIVIIITTILVTCLPTNVKAFVNTRLENGTGEFEGRFEVTRNTVHWESVCGSEGFDINDVIVICRQLGYPGANSAITSTHFGRGPYPMSDWAFACRGTEQHLGECAAYNTECRDQSVAGAVCYRSGSGYLGCFNDDEDYPVFNEYVVAYDITVTIDKCVALCAYYSYIYAGVKRGVKCFCGVRKNAYARYGKLTDSGCQVPCAGDPLRTCGGYESLAVFHIPSIRERVTVAATVQPRLTSRGTSIIPTTMSRRDEVTGRSNMTDHSSTVTGHSMVAKENPNFIKKPVGIVVVVAASLITVVLIILVICLIRRRKSSNDHERKQSLPAYDEVPMTDQSDWPGSNDKSQSEHPTKDHVQRQGERLTNEMLPDNTYYSHPKGNSANHDEDAIEYYATATKFTAQSYAHTYEQAELLPNETVPSTYYSVPDDKSTSGSRPSSHVMVNGDLYAKPMKESPNNSRPTSHVIVNDDMYAKPMKDGDTATELRYEYETVDGDTFITAEQYANNISENRDQNSHEIDPENSENDVNIADMYAKPMKKGRKANKKDSFDETCMVDNELYGN